MAQHLLHMDNVLFSLNTGKFGSRVACMYSGESTMCTSVIAFSKRILQVNWYNIFFIEHRGVVAPMGVLTHSLAHNQCGISCT